MESKSKILPDGTPYDTKEGPCAICLEETITNPVVLPCGHAFCFACVGSYQQSSTSKEGASCPYCRGEIPDVGSKAMDRSSLYSKRAAASPKGSEEQKKYAKLALAELDSVIELEGGEDNALLKMLELSTRLGSISMTGQPEETIKIAKELLTLMETQPNNILNPDGVKLTLAEAYLDSGKWDDAAMHYTELFNKKAHLGMNNRHVIKGLIQAYYEMKKYDKAIIIGESVIDTNRYCPGIHTYLALSQKAKGDIDGAKLTMSRAILYEKPWNKDNLQTNKQLLRELNNL